MAMVLFDQGGVMLLEAFFAGGTQPTGLKLHLIVAAATIPATGDSVPSFVLGTGEADPLEILVEDAYVYVTTVGGKAVPTVVWTSGGTAPPEAPLVEFTWDFTGAFTQSGSDGIIHGYCITDDADDEICAEMFPSPFTPEAGASLTLIPKIYLGNVGDF